MAKVITLNIQGTQYTLVKTAPKRNEEIRLELSKPGASKPYTVTYNEELYQDSEIRHWSCSCPGWINKRGNKRNCKHVQAMLPLELRSRMTPNREEPFMSISRQAADEVLRMFGEGEAQASLPAQPTEAAPRRRRRARVDVPRRRIEVRDGIAERERLLLEEAFQLAEARKQEKLMENALRLIKAKIERLQNNLRERAA